MPDCQAQAHDPRANIIKGRARTRPRSARDACLVGGRAHRWLLLVRARRVSRVGQGWMDATSWLHDGLKRWSAHHLLRRAAPLVASVDNEAARHALRHWLLLGIESRRMMKHPSTIQSPTRRAMALDEHRIVSPLFLSLLEGRSKNVRRSYGPPSHTRLVLILDRMPHSAAAGFVRHSTGVGNFNSSILGTFAEMGSRGSSECQKACSWRGSRGRVTKPERRITSQG